MSIYAKLESRKSTPQSRPIPGKNQVKNSAGGYAFQADKWSVLDRFLILGTEGGTYYVGEQKLTRDACAQVEACIKEDGVRAVGRIVEISQQGRAFKQAPAIFAHALAAKTGELEARRAAYDSLPKVARTATMLFSWLNCVKEIGGISAGVRRAVSRWYLGKSADGLAYQACKYRSREGWTHRDVLRVSHPPVSENPDAHALVMAWASGNQDLDRCSEVWSSGTGLAPKILEGFYMAQKSASPSETAKIIADYGVTREMVRTEHLADPNVWEALLIKMPMTAMLRNLGKMSSVGLLRPLSSAEADVSKRLCDKNLIQKSRIHPVAILNALKTYSSGCGALGKLSWQVSAAVVDALDKAFELSFSSLEPTGKRYYLAVDVSGSMSFGKCAGASALMPSEGAAACAMAQARIGDPYVARGFSSQMVDLGITARDSLGDALSKTRSMTFGQTDCAVPMLNAMNDRLEVDCFVVYTDSETWFGQVHPSQALDRYRQSTGINARMVVVGMEGNTFTIADPDDPGMLDVVGFDASCPRLIQEFSKDT